MLFENAKVQDVAEAVGVHRCTVWRWSKTKAFGKEWTRLSRNYKRRLDRSVTRIVENKEREMRQLLGEKLRDEDISDPQWAENAWANIVLDDIRRDVFRKRKK